MPPPSIRYSRPLSITYLVVGALMALTSLLTKNYLTGVVGLILVILALLQMRSPMLVIEGGEVQLRNPLGMTLKRFPVNGPADLRMEGKALMHVPTGRKIASLGFGMDKNDVAALQAHLAGQPGHVQQGPAQGGQPFQGQGPQGGQQWAPPQQGQGPQGGQQWAPPQQGQGPQGGPPQQ